MPKAVTKVVAGIVCSLMMAACQPAATDSQTAAGLQERVMASRTIRCGYFDWEPLLKKNVNTGQFTGIGADIMNEIDARLGIKHEWVEEVGPATAVESIKNKRIDMVCVPMTITLPRIPVVDFSDALFYGHFTTWVRADTGITDTAQLNNKQHKMIYMDGTPAMGMTMKLFSNAQTVSITENAPMSDLFSSVVGKKADAVIADVSNAHSFIKHNPGQIKPVFDTDTDRYIPWAFMTPPNEYQFTRMINLVLQNMQLDGTIAKIVKKHGAMDFYMPVQSQMEQQF